MLRKKSPVTLPGIDSGTFRLVAQRLNHYATQALILYINSAILHIWIKFCTGDFSESVLSACEHTDALEVARKETDLEVKAENCKYMFMPRDLHAGHNHNIKVRNKFP